MYGTKMKEQFNIAYVCAMAAQAGLNHNHPSVDDDSVDITLSGSAFPGKVRNPHIDLQLKCTSQNLISGQVIKFPLKKKNYDDLRGDNLIHPRLLVVLLVSPDKDKWIEHHPDVHVASPTLLLVIHERFSGHKKREPSYGRHTYRAAANHKNPAAAYG